MSLGLAFSGRGLPSASRLAAPGQHTALSTPVNENHPPQPGSGPAHVLSYTDSIGQRLSQANALAAHGDSAAKS